MLSSNVETNIATSNCTAECIRLANQNRRIKRQLKSAKKPQLTFHALTRKFYQFKFSDDNGDAWNCVKSLSATFNDPIQSSSWSHVTPVHFEVLKNTLGLDSARCAKSFHKTWVFNSIFYHISTGHSSRLATKWCRAKASVVARVCVCLNTGYSNRFA